MPARLTLASGEVVAEQVLCARSPAARARGLIGRPPLARGQALAVRGAQVHTFGVAYPLDVVFCDKRWTVLHVARRMPPRRVSRWVRGARHIVELPAGALAPDVVPGADLVLTHPSGAGPGRTVAGPQWSDDDCP